MLEDGGKLCDSFSFVFVDVGFFCIKERILKESENFLFFLHTRGDKP